MDDKKDFEHKVQQFVGYSKLIATVINWTFVLAFGIFISFKIFQFITSGNSAIYYLNKLDINYLYLIMAIILIFFNYYFEIKKWQFLTDDIEKRPFKKALIDVLYGLAAGILTPFMLGDFWGRVSAFKFENASKLIGRNMYNSLVQSWVAVGLGTLGLIYFNNNFYFWEFLGLNILFSVLLIILTLGLLYFLNHKYLIVFLSKQKIFKSFNQNIPILISQPVKSKIFGFTVVRNLIYNLQYLLIFKALHISIPTWGLLAGINIILLVKTLGGTLNTFLDLSMRSMVGIEIFSNHGLDNNLIIIATVLVWLINVIIPAVLGIILKIKSNKL